MQTSSNKEIGMNDFTGIWKLIKWTININGNEIFPYGSDAYGRLIYDANGSMSATLMQRNRPKFTTDDPMGDSPAEIVGAFKTFISYCGTFSINVENGTVSHHVEASSNPNWVGQGQIRSFEFAEGTLSLSTTPIESKETEGKSVVHQLVWSRMN
jgi:hypothetical protein